MGVSLNGGIPKTPKNDHFLVGKPTVVGYHHFRKPPYLGPWSNFQSHQLREVQKSMRSPCFALQSSRCLNVEVDGPSIFPAFLSSHNFQTLRICGIRLIIQPMS